MSEVQIIPTKIPKVVMDSMCHVGLEQVKKAFEDPSFREAFEKWKNARDALRVQR